MIVAIVNNKGGVLKTSLTVNLAAALYKSGQKVLVIDADNQGDVALSFGMNPRQFDMTLFDVLTGAPPFTAVEHVLNGAEPGDGQLSILVANRDMAFFDKEVYTNPGRYPKPAFVLKNALEPLLAHYDHILIDSPPSVGLLNSNILTAADGVIIPSQPELFSVESFQIMVQNVSEMREATNPSLRILGVVPTLVDRRTFVHSAVIQQMRQYGDRQKIKIFDTVIPRSIRFVNASTIDKWPMVLQYPKDDLSQVYFELLKEIEEVLV